MKMFITIFFLILCSGCSTVKESKYCQFTQEQKVLATKNLNMVIDEISDDSIVYRLPDFFVKESKAYSDSNGCRFILSPESRKKEFGVLDGEKLIILDRGTMSVKSVTDIAW